MNFTCVAYLKFQLFAFTVLVLFKFEFKFASDESIKIIRIYIIYNNKTYNKVIDENIK
jgi:hypothetical protein